MSWYNLATRFDGHALEAQTPNQSQLCATKDCVKIEICCVINYRVRINFRHTVWVVVAQVEGLYTSPLSK